MAVMDWERDYNRVFESFQNLYKSGVNFSEDASDSKWRRGRRDQIFEIDDDKWLETQAMTEFVG